MDSHNFSDHEAFKNFPNGAKLSWGLAKPSRRGPKGELNVKKIVDAAIEIADSDGLPAVSMNRVASRLGFTPMSLYRYISGKEDLLFLMQDAVCEIPIPPDDPEKDWRQSMREYVAACIQVFRRHPWFADIPITGVPLGPNNLRVVDWALRPLRRFPLNDFEKMSIILLLSGYSRSAGILQRDMDRAIQAGSDLGTFSGVGYGAALKLLLDPERFPDLYPIVASGAYTEESEVENTVGNDFDFGLERILDGIEHYLASKNAGANEGE